jgi:hypothetical protein
MRQAAALILLTVLAAAGCTSPEAPGPARPPAAITSSAASPGPVPQATAAGACPAAITPRPLPTWARAGFTPPTVAMPYVMGAQGNIVAILWAEHDPLRAPPLPDRSNKILWVSRLGLQPTDSLQIRATLSGTGRTVTREVTGGPGPSIINLPTAGCWSLNLSWSGHQDHLELRYVAS